MINTPETPDYRRALGSIVDPLPDAHRSLVNALRVAGCLWQERTTTARVEDPRRPQHPRLVDARWLDRGPRRAGVALGLGRSGDALGALLDGCTLPGGGYFLRWTHAAPLTDTAALALATREHPSSDPPHLPALAAVVDYDAATVTLHVLAVDVATGTPVPVPHKHAGRLHTSLPEWLDDAGPLAPQWPSGRVVEWENAPDLAHLVRAWDAVPGGTWRWDHVPVTAALRGLAENGTEWDVLAHRARWLLSRSRVAGKAGSQHPRRERLRRLLRRPSTVHRVLPALSRN